MNVTGCYIFFKRMTSVCNTNMRPLWCQKNESIGKMKTKKRVLCLLSIWMCTMGAAFADGAPEERAPGEKKGDAIITVPTLAISMLYLTDCS